ncbi:MAG: hypothetical protein RLZZ584_968 [Pseudomonadota bacterium]
MTPTGFAFASFTLDLARHRLTGPTGEVELRPKSFDVLAHLLANAGRLVGKAELIEAIWPDVVVTDDSLTRCISDVRLALQDSEHRLIRTVARRGYLIELPVAALDDAPAMPAQAIATPLAASGVVSAAAPSDAGSDAGDAAPATDGGSRPATAIYLDLRGPLEAIARRDAEAALAWYEGAVTRLSSILRRYGASVQRAGSEGLAGLFGVPLALEDHAVLASQAALDCQAAAVAGEGPGIGIASGPVAFRPLAGLADQPWTALGPTIDEARRLGRAADAGSTLLADATQRLLQGRFELVPAALSRDAVAPTPPTAWGLAAVAAPVSRFKASLARGLTRFVGRDAELGQLHRAARLAETGRGQVVAVIGEAGVGKSRLVHELVASLDPAQGWRVLEGAAVSYGRSTSHLPLIELLRRAFGLGPVEGAPALAAKVQARLAALDPALLPSLPALLALLDLPAGDAAWAALDPGERRFRMLAAVVQLVAREAALQPLLLVVEDLHWLDTETQAALDALVDQLSQSRLMLVVTYRPEYQHRWANRSAYTQLRLDALAPDDSARLLDALLGPDPALASLKGQLVRRGNPLFLEEAVRTLAEQGALVGAPTAYGVARAIDTIGIPATVQALVAARIDHLAPHERRVLEVASVIGRSASLVLLRAVLAQPEAALRGAVERLRAAEFVLLSGLGAQGDLVFRHALIHEVAYGGLLKARRRELHARIVAAIEALQGDRPAEWIERLAHHARLGELGERAVQLLRQAGLKAASRSALVEARQWFEQAIEVQAGLPDTPAGLAQGFEIRLELRGVLFQLGEAPALLERLSEAEAIAERLRDERRRSRVAAFKTSVHTMLGQLDSAVATGEQALQAAQAVQEEQAGGELELRINAANYLVQALYYRGDYDRVLALAAESLALWPDHWAYRYHVGNPAPASVFNRAFMAMALAQQGRFDEAARHEAEAIALAEPSHNAFAIAVAHTAAPTLHPLRGDWALAHERIERYIAVTRTGHISGFLANALAASAWVLAETGATAEAAARLTEARALLDERAAKGIGNLAWPYTSLARACLRLGRTDEAGRLGEQALAQATCQAGSAAHALLLLGDVASLQAGRSAEGEGCYRRALALAELRGMRPLLAGCHAGLALVCRTKGRLDEAGAHAEKAAALRGGD